MKEQAEEVFHTLIAKKGGSKALNKEELVVAHGGDFALFEQIDVKGIGLIDLEQWLVFIELTCIRKRHFAAKWLMSLLHTLRAGCLEQAKYLALREEANEVFSVLAAANDHFRENEFADVGEKNAPTGVVFKKVLLAALQSSDEEAALGGVFELMDEAKAGHITGEEWVSYMERYHWKVESGIPLNKSKTKGDDWLRAFLHTISTTLIDIRNMMKTPELATELSELNKQLAHFQEGMLGMPDGAPEKVELKLEVASSRCHRNTSTKLYRTLMNHTITSFVTLISTLKAADLDGFIATRKKIYDSLLDIPSSYNHNLQAEEEAEAACRLQGLMLGGNVRKLKHLDDQRKRDRLALRKTQSKAATTISGAVAGKHSRLKFKELKGDAAREAAVILRMLQSSVKARCATESQLSSGNEMSIIAQLKQQIIDCQTHERELEVALSEGQTHERELEVALSEGQTHEREMEAAITHYEHKLETVMSQSLEFEEHIASIDLQELNMAISRGDTLQKELEEALIRGDDLRQSLEQECHYRNGMQAELEILRHEVHRHKEMEFAIIEGYKEATANNIHDNLLSMAIEDANKRLENNHEDEIEAEHQKEVEILTTAHHKELGILTTAHQKELQTLKTAHESDIDQFLLAASETDAELNKYREEHKAHREQHEVQSGEKDEALNKYRAEQEAQSAKCAELEAKCAQFEETGDQLAKATTEVAYQTKLSEDAVSRSNEVEKRCWNVERDCADEVQDLKKRLEEAQSAVPSRHQLLDNTLYETLKLDFENAMIELKEAKLEVSKHKELYQSQKLELITKEDEMESQQQQVMKLAAAVEKMKKLHNEDETRIAKLEKERATAADAEKNLAETMSELAKIRNMNGKLNLQLQAHDSSEEAPTRSMSPSKSSSLLLAARGEIVKLKQQLSESKHRTNSPDEAKAVEPQNKGLLEAAREENRSLRRLLQSSASDANAMVEEARKENMKLKNQLQVSASGNEDNTIKVDRNMAGMDAASVTKELLRDAREEIVHLKKQLVEAPDAATSSSGLISGGLNQNQTSSDEIVKLRKSDVAAREYVSMLQAQLSEVKQQAHHETAKVASDLRDARMLISKLKKQSPDAKVDFQGSEEASSRINEQLDVARRENAELKKTLYDAKSSDNSLQILNNQILGQLDAIRADNVKLKEQLEEHALSRSPQSKVSNTEGQRAQLQNQMSNTNDHSTHKQNAGVSAEENAQLRKQLAQSTALIEKLQYHLTNQMQGEGNGADHGLLETVARLAQVHAEDTAKIADLMNRLEESQPMRSTVTPPSTGRIESSDRAQETKGHAQVFKRSPVKRSPADISRAVEILKSSERAAR